jgi:adenylate kinase
MRVIMLGAPGAGKGTQAIRISEKYSIPHISTGDIFRANIKEGTELGKKASEYIKKGMLVPDGVTIGIINERLLKQDCLRGFVLDGFPRNIAQAEELDRSLNEHHISIDAVINMDIPDEELVGRLTGRRTCLKCGKTYHICNSPPKVDGVCDGCGENLVQREDDNEKTVRERLQTYHSHTEPLIQYYKQKGILYNVFAKGDIDNVTQSIINIFDGLISGVNK